MVEEGQNSESLEHDAIVDTIVIQEQNCEPTKQIVLSNPFEVLEEDEHVRMSNRAKEKAVEKMVTRSDQHITCLVKDACHVGYCFYLITIYGRNNKLERRRLWRSLYEDKVVVHHRPCSFGVNFNVMRLVEEVNGGKL
ncbi:hypothetical protein LIER_33576 [Lithospermum erythrorhizon]|uniref:Uncharacterized protein n=1 Tax=Lithospermum erythrorhizon TaxID=34254 RepID=A0AAV3RX87_LITER